MNYLFKELINRYLNQINIKIYNILSSILKLDRIYKESKNEVFWS